MSDKFKLIDEQITKFENEIMILQGCVATLRGQKAMQEIKDYEEKLK